MSDVDNDKALLSRFALSKINEKFYHSNDLICFEETDFYIIKSNEAKNWHLAKAYIDNADVVASILSSEKEEV